MYYITLHHITSHHIASHRIPFHHIPSHSIAFHYLILPSLPFPFPFPFSFPFSFPFFFPFPLPLPLQSPALPLCHRATVPLPCLTRHDTTRHDTHSVVDVCVLCVPGDPRVVKPLPLFSGLSLFCVCPFAVLRRTSLRGAVFSSSYSPSVSSTAAHLVVWTGNTCGSVDIDIALLLERSRASVELVLRGDSRIWHSEMQRNWEAHRLLYQPCAGCRRAPAIILQEDEVNSLVLSLAGMLSRLNCGSAWL